MKDGHVTHIVLDNNGLRGTLPDVFTAFPRLKRLDLHNWPGLARPNDITGVLPQHFPMSLRALVVPGNPNLAGLVSKELILQSWDPVSQTKNTEFMQGPFIVGASFASEDIGKLLYMRQKLGISADMLKDVPKKGDPAMKMTQTHGDNWVAWQEVWLTGLQTLQNQNVFLMSLEGRQENYFRQKFEECTSDDKNKKNCFDPTYALPIGEAFSILDWERRQILAVAKTNNLSIGTGHRKHPPGM